MAGTPSAAPIIMAMRRNAGNATHGVTGMPPRTPITATIDDDVPDTRPASHPIRVRMTASGQSAYARLRAATLVLAIAGGIAIAISLGYDLSKERAAIIDEAGTRTRNLARMLEEHTRQTMRRLDATLARMANAMMDDGSGLDANPGLARARLQAELPADRLVSAFLVTDRTGRVTLTTEEPDRATFTDLAATEVFTAHRAGPRDSMVVGRPQRSSDDAPWVVPVSARLADAEGAFAGVLVALVEPAWFQSFYDAIHTGPDGFVTLFQRDGWILARSPANPEFFGRDWSGTPLFREHAPRFAANSIRQVVVATGTESIYTYRVLADYPVVATVGIALTHSLAPWRSHLYRDSAILFIVLAALGTGSYFILRLIDRARLTEGALAASEANLRAMAENLPLGVFLIDPRGRGVYRNRAMLEITGLDDGLIGAGRWLEIVHPEDRPATTRAWKALLTAAEPFYDTEFRVANARLGERIISARAVPIRNDAGTVIGFTGAAQDITAQRLAEATRTALEADLRQAQKMEAIGTLAGGVAHDFNNLLGAILGHATLLGDTPARNPGAAAESVGEIVRAAERARGLVRQILAFSRRQPLEKKPLAIPPLLDEAARLLRATLPASVEVVTHADPATPAIVADATQVQQVLLNLGTNGWHAVEGGHGTITLSTGPDDSPPAATHLPRGRYAHLSVTDDGKGMDAATCERIFEPFFTTKAPGAGTGLGLSVVHGIVQAHGGAILVDSAPGRGTTVHLWFPASEQPIANVPTERPPLPRGSGERIAVLDDERMIVLVTTRMLERLGYAPTGFTRPAALLDTLARTPTAFAAVVTDYTMPEFSGADVARRAFELNPDLPVILASGNPPDELMAEGAAHGICQVIGKPVAMETLAEVLAKVLNETRTDAAEPTVAA